MPGRAAAVTAPFALELEVEAGAPGDAPRLRALVKNIAKTGKRILVDSHLQPVELLLHTPEGKAIAPFDERSRKKFDTVRHAWLFRVLGPSSTWTAREDAFAKEDGGWALRFGSFTFAGLKPGRYRARLRFTSNGREWRDGERHGEYEDLWEGTVESPEVEIALP